MDSGSGYPYVLGHYFDGQLLVYVERAKQLLVNHYGVSSSDLPLSLICVWLTVAGIKKGQAMASTKRAPHVGLGDFQPCRFSVATTYFHTISISHLHSIVYVPFSSKMRVVFMIPWAHPLSS